MQHVWLPLFAILLSWSIGVTNVENAKFPEKLAVKSPLQVFKINITSIKIEIEFFDLESNKLNNFKIF